MDLDPVIKLHQEPTKYALSALKLPGDVTFSVQIYMRILLPRPKKDNVITLDVSRYTLPTDISRYNHVLVYFLVRQQYAAAQTNRKQAIYFILYISQLTVLICITLVEYSTEYSKCLFGDQNQSINHQQYRTVAASVSMHINASKLYTNDFTFLFFFFFFPTCPVQQCRHTVHD